MQTHSSQNYRRAGQSYTLPRFRHLTRLALLATASTLFLSLSAPLTAAETQDPLEPVNRATFKFNQTVDRFLFKPLATAYDKVTPRFAKSMLGNFFDNLGEVPNVVNDVLQGDIRRASNDLGRLAVNSTLGVGGLFEVADPLFGLEHERQDFGQTLAQWGVPEGPYLVLPLFGPSNLRDSLNVGVNTVIHPVGNLDHVATQNTLRASRAVDLRSDLLLLDRLIVGDPYLYQREAYIQHREYTINGDDMMIAFEEF